MRIPYIMGISILEAEGNCNQYELATLPNMNNCAPYAYTNLRNAVVEEIESNSSSENYSIKVAERFKKEIWQQLGLAGPVVMGNVMEYLTPLLALIFVGHIGKMEFAGAALATSMATSLGYILLVCFKTSITICFSNIH